MQAQPYSAVDIYRPLPFRWIKNVLGEHLSEHQFMQLAMTRSKQWSDCKVDVMCKKSAVETFGSWIKIYALWNVFQELERADQDAIPSRSMLRLKCDVTTLLHHCTEEILALNDAQQLRAVADKVMEDVLPRMFKKSYTGVLPEENEIYKEHQKAFQKAWRLEIKDKTVVAVCPEELREHIFNSKAYLYSQLGENYIEIAGDEKSHEFVLFDVPDDLVKVAGEVVDKEKEILFDKCFVALQLNSMGVSSVYSCVDFTPAYALQNKIFVKDPQPKKEYLSLFHLNVRFNSLREDVDHFYAVVRNQTDVHSQGFKQIFKLLLMVHNRNNPRDIPLKFSQEGNDVESEFLKFKKALQVVKVESVMGI